MEKATTRAYGRVAADQRDIGAVQRGDRARRRHVGRLQDVAREVCRRGVRNGVVSVHDVEAPLFGYAGDRIRQREQILRLPEQRIRWHLHAFE